MLAGLMISIAGKRRERMRGLRGRGPIRKGEALLIPRCRSVHSFGMRFPIKVAFLDGDMRVVRMAMLPPGRILLPRPSYRHALEMHPDTPLCQADRLRWSPTEEGTGSRA